MGEVPSLADLRCHDCAYRVGTDAHASEPTRILAYLCATAPEPFFCHVDDRLCAGWAAAANASRAPEWRREVARGLLALVDDAKDRPMTEGEFAARLRGAVLAAEPKT